MRGRVKWFNVEKRYGFIAPEDGSKDAFVHASAVISEKSGSKILQEGQMVEYDLEDSERGVKAVRVRIIQ